eukprot:m.78369 g.78369  ORF g.78369 m.78369 type:complete len:294 (+) comp20748_c0_seq1:208-1089(+)
MPCYDIDEENRVVKRRLRFLALFHFALLGLTIASLTITDWIRFTDAMGTDFRFGLFDVCLRYSDNADFDCGWSYDNLVIKQALGPDCKFGSTSSDYVIPSWCTKRKNAAGLGITTCVLIFCTALAQMLMFRRRAPKLPGLAPVFLNFLVSGTAGILGLALMAVVVDYVNNFNFFEESLSLRMGSATRLSIAPWIFQGFFTIISFILFLCSRRTTSYSRLNNNTNNTNVAVVSQQPPVPNPYYYQQQQYQQPPYQPAVAPPPPAYETLYTPQPGMAPPPAATLPSPSAPGKTGQ